MSTCQDEPEPLDDWNRIAELQQRNRVCPPHLKTSYPLESRVSSRYTAPAARTPSCVAGPQFWDAPASSPHLTLLYLTQPSLGLTTITDEEMKTGDPRETLRRASIQPTQVTEGITTRQRKRVSSESHQGPGTPEVGGTGSPAILALYQGSRSTIAGMPPTSLSSALQSKKATSCFPRPMTPRDRHEGRKQSTAEVPKKAAVKQVSGAHTKAQHG